MGVKWCKKEKIRIIANRKPPPIRKAITYSGICKYPRNGKPQGIFAKSRIKENIRRRRGIRKCSPETDCIEKPWRIHSPRFLVLDNTDIKQIIGKGEILPIVNGIIHSPSDIIRIRRSLQEKSSGFRFHRSRQKGRTSKKNYKK